MRRSLCIAILCSAVCGCGGPTASIEILDGDTATIASGNVLVLNGFRQHATLMAGRLTVNGKSYGAISDGATVIVEDDGRVLVNGVEVKPE
jgi:hypothetical protein